MLSVFPLSQENMLGFTIDGEIDAAGMRRFLTAVEAKVLAHDKIRLLGNIKDIGGFDSFQTFWDSLKAKKELWEKIEKYAVLTDSKILKSTTNSLDWVAPHMVIKTFALNEGELAHQWLKEAIEKPDSQGIKIIDLAHHNLLGMAIVGKMEVADYEKISYHIQDLVEQHGKARIFLEIVELQGISFRALWEDLKASVKHYGDIERVAIVGDQSWLKASVKVGDLLTPGLDMAAFNASERQRAINWLL